MKVWELIAELAKLPAGAEVDIKYQGWWIGGEPVVIGVLDESDDNLWGIEIRGEIPIEAYNDDDQP